MRDLNGIPREMNILFAGWMAEHEGGTDSIARVARYVRDNRIFPDSPEFPIWRTYESLKVLKTNKPKIRLQPYNSGDPIPSLRHLFT